MPVNFDNVQELPLVGGQFDTEFDTVLAGATFTIRQRWNTRDAAWYLDLYDVNRDPIFQGIKVVIGTGLGRRVADPRMPGVFVAADLETVTAGVSRDATFDDLGTRVRVYFYPFSEWFAS